MPQPQGGVLPEAGRLHGRVPVAPATTPGLAPPNRSPVVERLSGRARDSGPWLARRTRQGRGMKVRLGEAEVEEPQCRGGVVPGDKPLGSVDEQGPAGVVWLEIVPVYGVVGRGRPDIHQPEGPVVPGTQEEVAVCPVPDRLYRPHARHLPGCCELKPAV